MLADPPSRPPSRRADILGAVVAVLAVAAICLLLVVTGRLHP